MILPWLQALATPRDTGSPGVLVSVVAARGSTPRELGARMVVTGAEVHGSIGGGRLEHDATARAREMLATAAGAAVRRVPLGPSLGQCCGGTVLLLFQPTETLGWAATVRDLAAARRPCVVATLVDDGDEVPLGATLVVTATDVAGACGEPALAAAIADAARGMLDASGDVATREIDGRGVFLEPIRPPMTIVLFGAGHVGRALVPILGGLRCDVVWIDSRDAQHPPAPANTAVVVCDAPEDEVDAAPPGACFVVMTHSHDLDLRLSERILRRGDFAYFGLIGSREKRRRFEQRLLGRGIPAAAIERMRCPIGIDGIRGKHPGDIAVAVAAELLQVRGAG